MIFSLVSFFKGYLLIEVRGIFIERFINLAIKNNIYLWGISKKSKNCAHMKISIKGFFRIRDAARKTGVKVKILKRYGFTMFLHRHRKRKGFYIGFLIFVLIIAFLSSFIWTVEIEGNENISEEAIRQSLKECGIYPGALRFGHKIHEIQDIMMEKNTQLSWFWVDIKGTKAKVSIKERTSAPKVFDEKTPYNIVAKCDGVIENTKVTNGNQVINVGDVVKKGDLLVSGVYDLKYGGIRFLHSEGEVTAITWHTKKDTFPMERKIIDKTGIIKNKVIINVAGRDIQLYPFGKIKFKTFEESEKIWKIKILGDVYFPFEIKNIEVSETSEETIKMNEGEAFSYYRDMLFESLSKELGENIEILEKTATYEIIGEKIKISVTFKCREDIGEKIPLGG